MSGSEGRLAQGAVAGWQPATQQTALSTSIYENLRATRRFFAARSSSSSPHDAGVGRGPKRGAAPPLPSPLLHPMEERECLVAAPPHCAVSPTASRFDRRWRAVVIISTA